MSRFSKFLKNNPIKRPGIVAVVGNFDPPAAGHETVFNEAARLANASNLPLRIFVEDRKDNILTCTQRKKFIEAIFPRYKKYITEKRVSNRAFSDFLDLHFERVVYIGSPHRMDPTQLKETFDVYSSGVRDPENPSTQVTSSAEMIRIAQESTLDEFVKHLPSNTPIDPARELFEAIRVAHDLPKRPPVILEKTHTREEFYSGMFEVGERVATKELDEGVIASVGANCVVVNIDGQEKRYWPRDIIKL